MGLKNIRRIEHMCKEYRLLLSVSLFGVEQIGASETRSVRPGEVSKQGVSANQGKAAYV
jgi:hypothetical protein